MQFMIVVVSGLVALGILVFVHELGHFMVAKAAGIRVLKFSLGFGHKLLGFKHGETEYIISALPLGGYVKMAGENPKEDEKESIQPGDYFSKPWWMRILVLLAGPLMNIVAAIVILAGLYWIGFQVPIAPPQVIEISEASPAKSADIQPGDIISELGGVTTENWEVFSDLLNEQSEKNLGQAVHLTLLRQGEAITRDVVANRDEKSGRFILGITIAPAGTAVIDRVFVGTPAELAGFKSGDKVLEVEKQPIWNKYDFQQIVWPRSEQLTQFTVKRGEETIVLKAKPMTQQLPEQGKVGVIGVRFKVSDQEKRMHYPFFKSVGLGFSQTYRISKMILTSLGQLISGKISAKDSLGGPITIMRMAGEEAKSGVKDYFFFLVSISIMLAIVNLLPVPVLDGGSIVFFLFEGIFRKPIPMKVQEISQQIGFALLIGLMLFATYNDIYKIVVRVFGGAT
jgi:regulator of sigma E protease